MSVAIIPDFVKYQIEWLTSHNDLEFEPVIEDAIVQMLKDTGKSFIDEQAAETSQIDHIADSSKMVCVDAISRQETIHAISDWIYDATDERLPETVIRSLSAVQPEPHWIPCSERLPGQSGEYLVTLRVGYLPGRVIVDIARYIVDVGEWKNMYKVIAWMPLPEPYKGGDSE